MVGRTPTQGEVGSDEGKSKVINGLHPDVESIQIFRMMVHSAKNVVKVTPGVGVWSFI